MKINIDTRDSKGLSFKVLKSMFPNTEFQNRKNSKAYVLKILKNTI